MRLAGLAVARTSPSHQHAEAPVDLQVRKRLCRGREATFTSWVAVRSSLVEIFLENCCRWFGGLVNFLACFPPAPPPLFLVLTLTQTQRRNDLMDVLILGCKAVGWQKNQSFARWHASKKQMKISLGSSDAVHMSGMVGGGYYGNAAVLSSGDPRQNWNPSDAVRAIRQLISP